MSKRNLVQLLGKNSQRFLQQVESTTTTTSKQQARGINWKAIIPFYRHSYYFLQPSLDELAPQHEKGIKVDHSKLNQNYNAALLDATSSARSRPTPIRPS